MNIVVNEYLGLPKDLLKEKILSAAPNATVTIYEDRVTGKALKERGKDADIVIVANQPIPGEIIDAWENLKMLAVAFTGLDHIDLKACEKRNIPVFNASGYSDVAVAELVFGMILAWKRKIVENDRLTREGKIQSVPGTEIYGKTFGILGMGNIGKVVCKLAQYFGCHVLAWSRTEKLVPGVKWVSLEELLSQSDMVSIHLPYNKSTHHLIGEKELSLMKSDALLINIARGNIVDEEALVSALQNNTIEAALLDVYSTEPPLDPNHPLLKLSNVLLTPHVGFFTQEALERRANIVVKRIEQFLDETEK